MESKYPPGGLLGGSSSNAKPSKLAALAAARKKKQEEARNATVSPTPDATKIVEADNAVALLDKLSFNGNGAKSQAPVPVSKPMTDRKPTERKFPARKPSPESAPANVKSDKENLPPPKQEPSPRASDPLPDLRAIPSVFGATLCGLSDPAPKRQRVPMSFPLPYFSMPEFANSNPFAGPSPDDIVRNAQAKGAGRV